jgi:hypothetical protein
LREGEAAEAVVLVTGAAAQKPDRVALWFMKPADYREVIRALNEPDPSAAP